MQPTASMRAVSPARQASARRRTAACCCWARAGRANPTCALRLITEGAKLVADDRTELYPDAWEALGAAAAASGRPDRGAKPRYHQAFACGAGAHRHSSWNLTGKIAANAAAERRFRPEELPGLRPDSAPPVIRLKPFDSLGHRDKSPRRPPLMPMDCIREAGNPNLILPSAERLAIVSRRNRTPS